MLELPAENAVLIIGPAWVGDMVMAQSLFMTLKRQQPEVALDVLAPASTQALLARMPEVREGIVLPLGHGQLGILTRFRLGQRLRARHYRQAIVLPRAFKAALLPWFARIPLRTGFTGEWRYGLLNDRRPLDKNRLDQTVKRFVALGLSPQDTLQTYSYPSLIVDRDNQRQLFTRLNLNKNQPVVAILPGAEYGPAKQWPSDNYAALINSLSAQGRQCWILGSSKERALGDYIVQRAGSGRNLCGETSLPDAIDLLAVADAAVSNDSGLMHIAAAVGIPLVALYGSSSPRYTPPLSVRAEALYLELSCSPCFERHCPLGHLNCLRQLSVAQVHARLDRML